MSRRGKCSNPECDRQESGKNKGLCGRCASRLRRHGSMTLPPPSPKFPIEPIRRRVELAGGMEGIFGEGVAGGGWRLLTREERALVTAYHRGLAAGEVTMTAADQLCVRLLDLLPEEVYGPEWFAGVADAEPVADRRAS